MKYYVFAREKRLLKSMHSLAPPLIQFDHDHKSVFKKDQTSEKDPMPLGRGSHNWQQIVVMRGE